jgi:hypothetical protein
MQDLAGTASNLWAIWEQHWFWVVIPFFVGVLAGALYLQKLLALKRSRALACIWLAPIRKGYHKIDPQFRGVKKPYSWLPKSVYPQKHVSEKVKKQSYAIHLFPDELRHHYLKTGIVWYVALHIMAALSWKHGDSFVSLNIILAHWADQSPSKIAETIALYLLPPLYIITAMLIAYGIREALRKPWLNFDVGNMLTGWGSLALAGLFFLTYWYWNDIPSWLIWAMSGFLFFCFVAPYLIYVWWRRPVWENIDDQIPDLAVSHVNHAFQEHVIGARRIEPAFVKRLMLPYDGKKEPIYWRNSISNQEQMVNISLSILIMNALRGQKSGWTAYTIVFFFGPSLLFYLGLWVTAASGLFNPMLLGFLALSWAAISILHTMRCFNIVFKSRWRTGVPFTTPPATRAGEQYLRFEQEFSELIGQNNRITSVIGSVHFIFSVLLIAVISFAELAK